MRIGEVAMQAGVTVQTIRFYERRGLLRQPQRLRSGYRDYPAQEVQTVRLIKQFQEHGFTLGEIEVLMRLLTEPAAHLVELRAQVEAKLNHLTEKMQALESMRHKLHELHVRLATGQPHDWLLPELPQPNSATRRKEKVCELGE